MILPNDVSRGFCVGLNAKVFSAMSLLNRKQTTLLVKDRRFNRCMRRHLRRVDKSYMHYAFLLPCGGLDGWCANFLGTHVVSYYQNGVRQGPSYTGCEYNDELTKMCNYVNGKRCGIAYDDGSVMLYVDGHEKARIKSDINDEKEYLYAVTCMQTLEKMLLTPH